LCRNCNGLLAVPVFEYVFETEPACKGNTFDVFRFRCRQVSLNVEAVMLWLEESRQAHMTKVYWVILIGDAQTPRPRPGCLPAT